MKLYIRVLLLFFTYLCYGQEPEVKVEGTILLDITYHDSINIYQNYNADKIFTSVKHNFAEEDYLYFEILENKNDMYYISANYFIKGFIIKGWVKKDTPYFGIYTKAYSGDLVLFAEPNKSSKKYIVKEYNPELYRVFDCNSKWLLIEFALKGKKYKAWIEPSMQCDNPYTTCN